jgi:hypothetical protein
MAGGGWSGGQGRGGTGQAARAGNVPAMIWNSWAERHADGAVQNSFNAVDVVGIRETVLVTLDLSGIEYAPHAAAALSRSAGPVFRQRLSEWLDGADTTIHLRAVVVADPAYFENPFLREETFDVRLDRIRSYGAAPRDPIKLLRLDPEAGFRFGHASVALKTRGRAGWAPISITLWTPGGRPIEEVPFSVCISRDAAKPASAACPGARPTRAALGGFDSLRAATGETADPDVALHILSMPGNNEVFGVMAIPGRPDKIAWPIEGGAEQLRDALSGYMFRLLADASSDEAWLMAGRQLRNLLFPDDAPDDPGEQFDQTIESVIESGRKPSVYVRMLQTPAAPFVFPIGAISVGDHLLGLQSRVETPLPSQAYATPGSCVSQWALVAPPEGYADDALRGAREAADPTLAEWTDVSWPFSTMRAFGDWLLTPPSPLQAPAGIFVLSHHEENILHFVKEDQIGASALKRKLTEPSVVVLNACGGARASAQGFVTAFNLKGATSIVTTITEVEAPMAGTFAACWTREMGRIPSEGMPIGDVFERARQCVYDVKDGSGASRWGAKVLKYVLLGDASTRLCPARR